ncbi:hypothetical protein BWQ96_01734 [Gracilariopsis chorda]|uniref:Uncharacterized protein n=1 Tax=Gracilariopsis chorda TaxID=448386 RepID=A0A2V3J2G3_9FLOR|nr:hypothetical protein BWQ96_01734 [Gracilariopsis chorda]|eukprot:PXF48565.1 hypothetical protein BWQ96_01734 [Gracilariopsis chorda]
MSKLARLIVLYTASFASMLSGAHLVHITVKPDMTLNASDTTQAQETAPDENNSVTAKAASSKPLISIAIPQTTQE